ncbi:acetyltransferase [Aeromonas phage vB_AspA_Tola]|nr:acetyltransferase [Aeromonas phage vB_AspA_Tola]
MSIPSRFVRQATLSDLLFLGEMAKDYREEADRFGKFPVDYDKLMKNLATTVVAEDGYLGILIVNDKPVGALWGCLTTMPWSSTKVAQDAILFVNKNHRGVGKLLIRDWERWASESGAVAVCISTASGLETERVCKLYELMGYQLTGHTFLKEI